MERMTIRVTEAQAEHLRNKAKEQGISVSELVRHIIDQFLLEGSVEKHDITDEMRERAKAAVGFVSSAESDVSTNHDKYLADIYAESS